MWSYRCDVVCGHSYQAIKEQMIVRVKGNNGCQDKGDQVLL